jgi:hypothetical protein
MTEIIIGGVVFGSSVVLAYVLRRVARLQAEARSQTLPDEAETVSKEITTHTYQVQFQLKRLKQGYPDPLTALVNALHGRTQA